MAMISDLETRICIVWNTERPFKDRPRKSTNFSFLDSVWNLTIALEKDAKEDFFYYKICLQQGAKDESLKTYFSITTLLEDERNEGCYSLRRFTTVNYTQQCIWRFKSETVSKSVQSMKDDYGKWRILVLFHCGPACKLQTGSEIIHLSTQTDFLTPGHDSSSLTLSKGILSAAKSVQVSLNAPPDLESLSLDFSKLLEYKMYPDVELRCGDRPIPAHRSILAARSEVFSAMFDNKLSRETGIVEVTDLDAPVLDMLLGHAYTGKVPALSDDTACSLYLAADKYAIQTLKKSCLEWMIGNLTEDNCVDFLTVVDPQSDADFKDSVGSFISNHPAVMTSKVWLKFSSEHAVLANEIYHYFVTSVIKK